MGHKGTLRRKVRMNQIKKKRRSLFMRKNKGGK